ncbi:MAG: hypothetical protein RLZZ297_1498 [Chloroflexota bacterium]|jgi:CubicO group peptidase (beta-lactamase class C family)
MTSGSPAQIIRDAIAQQVFPGAVHAVGLPDGNVISQAYGAYRYETDAPAVTVDTCYDWASLTKILCATAVLRLVSVGVVRLDDPIQAFLPQSAAYGVTVRHLLTHTSGLDIRLSTGAAAGANALWQAVYQTVPRDQPGVRVAYANVNTLLLGALLERVCGVGLDMVLADLVYAPVGMTQTQYCPAPAVAHSYPPTENDPLRGVIQGSVHDESTAALGGVAGHAGVFGSAADAIRFCQGWLATLRGESPWEIDVTLARAAVTNQSPAGQLGCGYGWMLAREQFMGAAHAETAAHTGFTGPVLAIVPRADYCWVLLSNRTWPQRTPMRHHPVTAAVSSAQWQARGALADILSGYV